MTDPNFQVATPSSVVAPTPLKTNVLAIVALISAFFVPLAGIITGHIALSQINKTGQPGRGLALAGTVLGYVFTGIFIIIIVVTIIIIGAASNAGYSTP
jgi:hypothetical protein